MEEAKEKLHISRIIYPENTSLNLGCQLCNCLVPDMLRICENCQFQLCDGCYGEYFFESKCCTKCKSKMKYSFKPIMKKELADIKIKCKYFGKGCIEPQEFSSYISHEASCEYRAISCEACKNHDILYKDKDNHNKSCGFIKIPCNEYHDSYMLRMR